MDDFTCYSRDSTIKRAKLLIENSFESKQLNSFEDFDQSPLYSINNINSRIVITTASSLQLCGKFCKSPVRSPSHIVILSDDHETLMDLLVCLYLSPRLLKLKSLTILVPVCCENNISRFITEMINTASAPIFLSKVFNWNLNGVNRQLVTFKNSDFSNVVYKLNLIAPSTSIEMAHNFAESCFETAPCNSVDQNSVKNLVEHLSIRQFESFWCLDCHEQFLPLALSSASAGGVVVVTTGVSVFVNLNSCLSRHVEVTKEDNSSDIQNEDMVVGYV